MSAKKAKLELKTDETVASDDNLESIYTFFEGLDTKNDKKRLSEKAKKLKREWQKDKSNSQTEAKRKERTSDKEFSESNISQRALVFSYRQRTFKKLLDAMGIKEVKHDNSTNIDALTTDADDRTSFKILLDAIFEETHTMENEINSKPDLRTEMKKHVNTKDEKKNKKYDREEEESLESQQKNEKKRFEKTMKERKEEFERLNEIVTERIEISSDLKLTDVIAKVNERRTKETKEINKKRQKEMAKINADRLKERKRNEIRNKLKSIFPWNKKEEEEEDDIKEDSPPKKLESTIPDIKIDTIEKPENEADESKYKAHYMATEEFIVDFCNKIEKKFLEIKSIKKIFNIKKDLINCVSSYKDKCKEIERSQLAKKSFEDIKSNEKLYTNYGKTRIDGFLRNASNAYEFGIQNFFSNLIKELIGIHSEIIIMKEELNTSVENPPDELDEVDDITDYLGANLQAFNEIVQSSSKKLEDENAPKADVDEEPSAKPNELKNTPANMHEENEYQTARLVNLATFASVVAPMLNVSVDTAKPVITRDMKYKALFDCKDAVRFHELETRPCIEQIATLEQSKADKPDTATNDQDQSQALLKRLDKIQSKYQEEANSNEKKVKDFFAIVVKRSLTKSRHLHLLKLYDEIKKYLDKTYHEQLITWSKTAINSTKQTTEEDPKTTSPVATQPAAGSVTPPATPSEQVGQQQATEKPKIDPTYIHYFLQEDTTQVKKLENIFLKSDCDFEKIQETFVKIPAAKEMKKSILKIDEAKETEQEKWFNRNDVFLTCFGTLASAAAIYCKSSKTSNKFDEIKEKYQAYLKIGGIAVEEAINQVFPLTIIEPQNQTQETTQKPTNEPPKKQLLEEDLKRHFDTQQVELALFAQNLFSGFNDDIRDNLATQSISIDKIKQSIESDKPASSYSGEYITAIMEQPTGEEAYKYAKEKDKKHPRLYNLSEPAPNAPETDKLPQPDGENKAPVDPQQKTHICLGKRIYQEALVNNLSLFAAIVARKLSLPDEITNAKDVKYKKLYDIVCYPKIYLKPVTNIIDNEKSDADNAKNIAAIDKFMKRWEAIIADSKKALSQFISEDLLKEENISESQGKDIQELFNKINNHLESQYNKPEIKPKNQPDIANLKKMDLVSYALYSCFINYSLPEAKQVASGATFTDVINTIKSDRGILKDLNNLILTEGTDAVNILYKLINRNEIVIAYYLNDVLFSAINAREKNDNFIKTKKDFNEKYEALMLQRIKYKTQKTEQLELMFEQIALEIDDIQARKETTAGTCAPGDSYTPYITIFNQITNFWNEITNKEDNLVTTTNRPDTKIKHYFNTEFINEINKEEKAEKIYELIKAKKHASKLEIISKLLTELEKKKTAAADTQNPPPST
ncbi:MAG: hypothetical protein NkDv07_0517 [Candidatus Improbicoccus devescovinae]|nr:MAG: hypothetical protein NkDv07_0517 [Candidatus Improbicoccus devescovinae]